MPALKFPQIVGLVTWGIGRWHLFSASLYENLSSRYTQRLCSVINFQRDITKTQAYLEILLSDYRCKGVVIFIWW